MKARLYYLISIVCLGACGCASVRDITNSPLYPTDYDVNQIYELKQPVFVKRMSSTNCLVRPGQLSDVPRTIEEYRSGDARRWKNIKGWLPAGTKLRYRKMLVEKNYSIGIHFTVVAEVLTPQHSGLIVDLLFISNWLGDRPATVAPKVDADIMTVVRDDH